MHIHTFQCFIFGNDLFEDVQSETHTDGSTEVAEQSSSAHVAYEFKAWRVQHEAPRGIIQTATIDSDRRGNKFSMNEFSYVEMSTLLGTLFRQTSYFIL